MVNRTDPAAVRWLVGNELARLRQAAGLSVTAVARLTGLSKTSVSHKESGKSPVTSDDLGAILEAIGQGEQVDRLARLISMADTRTWWAQWEHVIPPWLRTAIGLEGFADSAFLYEPMIMPGVFQTAEYAAALTRASGFVRPDFVAPIVAVRQARAQRLRKAPVLSVHAAIEESVLRRAVGSETVMRDQVRHLADLAELPNVTVQVIRPEDGPHAAVAAGSFEILRFSDARPVGYVELFDSAIYVKDDRGMRTYELFAESVADVALSAEDSIDLMRAILNRGD